MSDAPTTDPRVDAEAPNVRQRSDAAKRGARARLVALARTILPVSDGLTPALVTELCHQAGLTHATFRTLFPEDVDLLRAVNDALVEECAARLGGAAAHVTRTGTEEEQLAAAARALAEQWPMDWASLSIRARERADALSTGTALREVLDAERRFVPALLDALLAVMARLDRQFVWEPILAVRVIVLAYERSFEAWVMGGGDERTFPDSPFVQQTLPAILAGVSAPVATRAG